MTHPPRWTQPELEWLEQLAGDVPFPTLLRSMHYKATAEGWPRRTDKAIVMRMRRSRQFCRARTGEWTTTYGAGEILGCPGTRVEAWLRRKPIAKILDPQTTGGTRYINRRSWRRLAKQMPRAAEQHPRPMGDWRVRCVETGQVFSSCGAAARELHVTQACISLAIRQARPVAALGMTFQALRGAGPVLD
jgi:hypothetical protein